MPEISTKPYLLRAIYEWCTDSGYTPHIAVKVNHATKVPANFVKNGEIVLNISFTATHGLKMDNDCIRFSARFGGVSKDIYVPVENVMAIYANENGQGMAFEVRLQDDDTGVQPDYNLTSAADAPPTLSAVQADDENQAAETPQVPKKTGKPTLTRIK